MVGRPNLRGPGFPWTGPATQSTLQLKNAGHIVPWTHIPWTYSLLFSSHQGGALNCWEGNWFGRVCLSLYHRNIYFTKRDICFLPKQWTTVRLFLDECDFIVWTDSYAAAQQNGNQSGKRSSVTSESSSSAASILVPPEKELICIEFPCYLALSSAVLILFKAMCPDLADTHTADWHGGIISIAAI